MYYARYINNVWRIYKKRKLFFDKVVFTFGTDAPNTVYDLVIVGELERLNKEG